jgi:putative ABC transport system substrate-binding protein
MRPRRLLLVALATAPFLLRSQGARSQAKQKPVVIAWLALGPSASDQALAPFKEGLARLGWKEGAQYVLEARWAEGSAERLMALAHELVALRPAVMVGTSAQATTRLARASSTIPIVQATGTSPVETKLAASLARPGGIVTGLTNLATEISEKLAELLSTVEPKVKRVGFLIHQGVKKDAMPSQLAAARRSAERFSFEPHFAHAATADELERALAAFAAQGVQALLSMPSPYYVAERSRILGFAHAQRWPVVTNARTWPEHGALFSYGIDGAANHRRAAYYVDRILKGAKPGDLPIEQPREFELIVNLRVAKTLGLRIPQAMLLQASRLIE